MSNELTALDVYNAYPSSDLLGCGPPADGESDEDYVDRVEDEGGDTLFLFFLRELLSGAHDEVTLEEAESRLARAKLDVEALEEMVADKRKAAAAATE